MEQIPMDECEAAGRCRCHLTIIAEFDKLETIPVHRRRILPR
jgi:hypothetical protein